VVAPMVLGGIYLIALPIHNPTTQIQHSVETFNLEFLHQSVLYSGFNMIIL